MGVPCHTVTGYAKNGRAVCTGCCQPAGVDPDDWETSAIFLGDEWDAAPSCDECGEEIEVNILSKEHE